ncbi:MAG: cyclic nucleotide-binding domain-containing protein [Planctomycetota bacterium]
MNLAEPASDVATALYSDLQSHPVLGGHDADSAALAGAGQRLELPAGSEVYRPGDTATAFYLVLQGEAEAYVGASGQAPAVWVFGPGDAFGEHALLRGGDRARTSGVRIKTAAVLFEIPAAAFERHLAERMRAGRDDHHSLIAPAVQRGGLDALRGLVLGADLESCRVESFAPGATVVMQGVVGDAAYFVIRGSAQAVQDEKAVAELTEGQCFGELAVLDGVPRSASVVAKTPLVVLRVAASTFVKWVGEHPPLRSLVAMQRQLYLGPTGASVTMVGRSTCDGEPCITSTVCYADGRRYSATKLTERDRMIWQELSQPGEAVTVVEHQRDGAMRRLHLAEDRRILKIEAEGDPAGIASLCARLIARSPFKPALEARFRWSGTTDKPATGELLCACVGLTVEDAKTLDPAVLRSCTGAGSICGSCLPNLRALQPAPAQAPAAPATRVKAARPAPTKAVPRQPSRFTGMPYIEFVEKVVRKEIELPKAAVVAEQLEAERPDLFAPADAKFAGAAVVVLARFGVTLAAMIWCAAQGFYLPLVALWVVQGFNLYAVAAVTHDLAHGAAFSKAWLNRVVGSLMAVPLLARFGSFRDSHLEHHRTNQSFDDPKVVPPSDNESLPKAFTSTVRVLYDRVFMKLPAAIQNLWMISWLLPLTAPIVMLRYEFSALRKIRNRGDAADTAVILAVWAAAVLLMGGPLAAWVLIAPLCIGYLCVAAVFMTHGSEYTLNAPVNDPEDYELMVFNIGNLTMGRWLDRWSYHFHRYHVEHHLLPTLPHHRLPEVAEMVQRDHGDFLLPARRLSFHYFRRGWLDGLRHPTRHDIAGKTYFTGSLFDQVRFGEADAVPLLR